MLGMDRCLRVPLGTLVIGLLWLSSVLMLVVDSLDERFGMIGAWALMVGMVAAVLSVAALLEYSRRVALEVNSWEHRQLAGEDSGRSLRLAGGRPGWSRDD